MYIYTLLGVSSIGTATKIRWSLSKASFTELLFKIGLHF